MFLFLFVFFRPLDATILYVLCILFLYFLFFVSLCCFGEMCFTIGHEVVLAPLFLNSYKSFRLSFCGT